MDDPRERVIETLGICGCGEPDEVIEWVRDYLRLLKAGSHTDYFGGEAARDLATRVSHANLAHLDALETNGLAKWIALYWLDSRGLLEHGGSIIGSWMTEKGEETLKAIEGLEVRECGSSSD